MEDIQLPTESQEVIDLFFLKQSIEQNKKYLLDTDWYCARKIETSKDIPEEIVAKRQEARDFISANNATDMA